MKNNLFNKAASTVDEAVVILNKAIEKATNFELSAEFNQLSEDDRDNLVEAIYRSQNLNYRYEVLKTACDQNSREDNNAILSRVAQEESDNLNRLLTAF